MSDLILSEGDLVISQQDLLLEVDEETEIVNSIKRRIKTTISQYSIKLIDINTNNINIIDDNYGTDIVSSLSSPVNTVLNLATVQLKKVLEQESRIKDIDFKLYPLNEYTLKVSIYYTYKGVGNTIEL
jgi:hypothetical protein